MTDTKLYDSRVAERNIKSGALKQADYDKYIAGLEDCTDLGEETETQMVFTSQDEDESADESTEA
jgi:hypothetical protein